MIRRILVTSAVLASIALMMHASPVLGQVGEGIAEDNLPMLEMERPLMEWVCAFLFGAAALAIGFMPSKRAHDE